MSDPFIGEIRMIGFGWAPKGWALCNGQTLTVAQNQALYSLLGVQFGGTTGVNFMLPDLQGRMPVCAGTLPSTGEITIQGTKGGFENIALTVAQMPLHTHQVNASSTPGDSAQISTTSVFAQASGTEDAYNTVINLTLLNDKTCSSVGKGQGHNNMQPSLAIGFCIALQGFYPSRS